MDDIDHDGLSEIVLTSHGGSFTQVFRQIAPRQFLPLDRVDAVGFHPNDFARLPTDPPLYVANAEGPSELRLFSFDDQLVAHQVSTTPISRPVHTTPFFWPGYGWSAAVVSYRSADLRLLFGFDEANRSWGGERKLTVGSKPIYPLSEVVSLDIDGDEVNELLLTVPRERRLVAIRRPENLDELTAETIWTFNDGQTHHFAIPAHIDGDTHKDLLVVGHTSHLVHVLMNRGDGHFDETQIPIPDSGVIHAAFSVDSDGTRYLFIAGKQKLILMELEGDSAEVVSQKDTPTGGMALMRVALRDLDADGWLDLVIARNGMPFNNAIVYGPLKDHFPEIANASLLDLGTGAEENQDEKR
jgi:hypothetical protein